MPEEFERDGKSLLQYMQYVSVMLAQQQDERFVYELLSPIKTFKIVKFERGPSCPFSLHTSPLSFI